ncbi:NAD-dependent epimerase/dehydratase family protein [Desulfobacter latus]|uniref:NAD-dependent epimerase/dehydratase family protein n=1 Tax=Desulfobacter latus TaxID=2292 RepID=UPI001C49C86F
MIKTVLVTGATGFLGQIISRDLCQDGYQVIGISRSKIPKQETLKNFEYIRADISDTKTLAKICNDRQPDVIVHCAGIAHQRMLHPLPDILYDKINHWASMNLAKIAGKANPNLYFIFLSSICVYGEIGCINFNETNQCNPTSSYAKSKLAAETILKVLFQTKCIRKLDILRLAPVYETDWRLNLEKRICVPGNWFYFKYGSGQQKLSILARKNVVDFIRFRIKADNSNHACSIMNISDFEPCSFNDMIRLMNSKSIGHKKPVFTVPFKLINIASQIAKCCFPTKKQFISSCHHKLVRDIVINNQRMLETGFKPRHTITNTFKTK